MADHQNLGDANLVAHVRHEVQQLRDVARVQEHRRLVEEMRGMGVAQIVIVSHDEELVGAADDLVRVEKSATTNRSHVERVERIEETVAELAD